jgi:hypothetical protein
VVVNPADRGAQQAAAWSRPFRWLWAKRAWVAAAIGIVFLASTLYVLWAIRDQDAREGPVSWRRTAPSTPSSAHRLHAKSRASESIS